MNWTYHAAVRGPDAAPATCRTPELAGLLSRWRDDLASWAIPEHILDAVAESPWVLPGKVFARRADRLSAEPAGPSFVTALTAYAGWLVVIEAASVHPLTSLNELWLRFHGLARPSRPTGDDILAILTAMGLRCGHERWSRPAGADYESFAELTDVTCRRLCLPPQRAADVADALIDAGVDPQHPQDLGSSGRDVLTIWWAGRAQN